MISKYDLVVLGNILLKRKGKRRNEKINNYFRKKGMIIGENCKIFSNISTTESYLIKIDNDVSISTNVRLITHDNSVCKIDNNYTDVFGRISISNNCFIGENAIILPGVTLAPNIIVGAGSVVTKSFDESNIVIAGNPARKINTFDGLREKTKKYAVNVRKMSLEEKRSLIEKEDICIIK